MEETIELKKYLKKLIFVIEKETTFSFFNTVFIDTKRLDDILCCIEASWPEKYKAFKNKKSNSIIKSSIAYKKAILAIKNKFTFKRYFLYICCRMTSELYGHQIYYGNSAVLIVAA